MIALERCIEAERKHKKMKTAKEQNNRILIFQSRWQLWILSNSNGNISEPERRMKNDNMSASTNPLIISLKNKRSPLPQQHWVGTIDHPQLVADAFNRSIDIYWNTPRETENCLFVPLTTTPEKLEPIIIVLDINHFLLAKRKPIRDFTWPKINPFHKAIVKRYCLSNNSIIY
ncbi:hypothetical protein PHYBLDRAFT_173472 [Phycomyces blakesleeanus NRRL 1555(-)]|uniref:Uncharacterized protein n=1 Tax=Phycomyces blakesleeanus (strain ATCC 8743b / DSM 1359 / FGSC 10004 / NBRC 33097 / NRRL 1555) TaxID=763407 RepID=A0A162TGV5_PHYB8|nr:hypothetical protein PHYBLDRAFT_173472 [Phycomyces blakesleeanus NRRL 1555(-)]OAD68482.1 hypothetical protein PHYBLDRAFT_173472 [Phycomyces blakesleeanus NRRL 1555(-)]|eukprot:XP_018286522.1 hypothetical protein PHYBLDRAFT_173472 [Phycomyces blakesleeanus NRRL 1555(-)]